MGDIAAGAGPDDDEDLSTVGDEAIGEDEQFLAEDDMSAYITMVSVAGIVSNRNLLLPPSMRQKGERDPFWLTDEGKGVLESLAVPDLVLRGLTDLVTQVSDISTVECLKKNFKDKLRDAFEISTPQVQCANTIGPPVFDETPCWICGFPIPSNNAATTAELSPECEHVFPVAQALCFTGLYESQMFKRLQDDPRLPTGSMAEAYVAGVRLEYDWAHRICNQVKKDTHFVDYDGTNFIINPERINVFLNSILTTQSYGTGAAFARYISAGVGQSEAVWRPQWIAIRTAAIQARCQELLNAAVVDGMTPTELACCTVMSMRSFIVSTGKCVAMKESIPSLPGFGANSNQPRMFRPVRPADSPLRSTAIVSVAEYSLNRGVESVTGIFDKFIDKLPRGDRPPATTRGKLIAFVLEAGNIWKNTHKEMFIGTAKNLRDQIAYQLITGENTNSEETIWSTIQARSTIVIQAAIYDIIATNLFNAIYADAAPKPETDQEILRVFKLAIDIPAFKAELTEWRNAKVDKVKNTFMIPYDAILATVVPAGNEWRPGWYLAGGLRKRRPLYSNVSPSTLTV
jgi:hypothetical protein